MKKRKVKSCFALLLALGLVSCQNENISSSIESSSSENSSSESSSSEQIITVKSLSEAIANTSSYSFDVELNDGSTYVYQIFTEDFFYYRPNSEGYLILDSDPDFIHAFTTIRHEDNYYDYDMNVHGRNYVKSDRSTCFYVDFLDILRKYADDFVLSGDKTYSCSVSAIGSELKEYFQSRAFAYTNYFEVKVGNDGRLASFTSYEKDESGTSEYGTCLFKKFDKENYTPYKKWKDDGSKIDLRIIDLKTGYMNNIFYKLCYENKEVEITGVVTSFDSDGNYYIANEDDVNGYAGIKIKPSNSDEMPTITDSIKVKGKVKQDGFVAYIDEANFEKVGENAYFPYFDEESIHSMYGGGYYAAYMFAQTPYYAGSLYSTYAYVNSLPTEVTEENTIVELVCPAFKYTNGGYFKIGLELPSSLGIEKREEILESLKQYGVYSEKDNTAEEISFEKFVVGFDASYDNIVKLVYANGSEISKSLSPAEKVQKDFELESFPFPEKTEYGCYHFGGSSGMYLESVYGKDSKDTLGIYYYAQSLSDNDIQKVTNGLLSAGFVFSDEIKDVSTRRHSIYKKDTLVVDILLENNSFDGTKTINMWIYKGDLVYTSTIAEILKEKVPFFDTDDFVYVDGTYSADYTYYGLPNMAGQKYEKGSYLTCITIDLNNSSAFSNIRSKYREEKGYKLYRNDDGSQYTYRTRGQNHYVYYKEIEGSDEKIFVDLAQYPTTDYTFLNHSDFANRVEVLIYKGKQPLSTIYESDLNTYFKDFNERNGLSGDLPSFSLPADTKVEMVYAFDPDDMDQYDYTRYGYYSYLQCYVYTKELSSAYTALVDGLKKNGYKYYSTSEKGNECYCKEGKSDTAFILLMKGTSYIRILEGIGGIDF